MNMLPQAPQVSQVSRPFWARPLVKSLVRIALAVAVVLFAIWVYVQQPSLRGNQRSTATVAPDRLRDHVRTLSVDFFPRNPTNKENLQKSADYIARHFTQAGAKVELQTYRVGTADYSNVIGRFGRGQAKKLVVGAHYDSCDETPGADDNASGTAGLIELAYLLGRTTLKSEVELVAYTLEEPPYFMSGSMGSVVHAGILAPEKSRILGVVVFEMIGYFDSRWGTQSYPMPLLNIIYPNRGNYIAVVGNDEQRVFTKAVKVLMKGTTDLPVRSLNAPERVPGVNFSDHASYWPHGINAVMVTDTAFYRNNAYHTKQDTYDRLNYDRMADVVVAVYEVVKGMSQSPPAE